MRWIVLTVLLPVWVAAAEPPIPKMPDLCGFAVFRVCGASGNRRFPQWIAVAPSMVTTITNPLESPAGCVKISSVTGRGIYVFGDEQEAAHLLRQAELERREDLCGQ
jgi:hypothetical protein